MSIDLLIHNAMLVTPTGVRHGGVAIRDGRIVEVLNGPAQADAAQALDAGRRWLLPGVVDIHVHFREPGQAYKATYQSESRAAAAGGVTTICDMPNNGAQAVVNAERFAAKRLVGTRSSHVDFGLYCYLVGRSVDELRPLVEAGVMGFKWDMSLAGTEVAPGYQMPMPEEALACFRAAASLGALVGIHAEDRPLVQQLSATLRAAGRLDPHAHVEARPVAAEVAALRQALDLARASGVRLHVHHLSSAEGLALVRAAKDEGLRVTAETIPAFLFLDDGDYERLGTVMKIHPAVKYRVDRDALWEGLRDGTLDCVATDHAPHTVEEKSRDVWEASPGAIGVQTSLSLMLSAVAAGRLSLQRCVEVLSSAPARVVGLAPEKGAIVVGAAADLVLVDLAAHSTIRNEQMYSPNHLTPFDGWPVQGVPLLTVLRGTIVARDGEIVGEPQGRMVSPG